MKKIIVIFLPVLGIFQSCTNKSKTTQSTIILSDSLVLMQHSKNVIYDSIGIGERHYNERPTHVAHYSANLTHYQNGQYHNGNY